jgi:alkanesulfonate monooxygenase SsuD/methylene tetrahydromethanopterin reductase-like flavin-dependent oxidoreductase (luciferase family)
MLSALAASTKRVELGTLVSCNSFRNPALLAKMAHTVDEISGGRLILGLGAGWNEPEYRAYGIPFDHRVSRLEEALQVVQPLLKLGKVDFHGKYYQAEDCEIRPRGPRPAGPPLMVGGGEPRMLKLVAQYADLWNVAYMGAPETFTPWREKMAAACREVGRDPATLGLTVLAALHFPDLYPAEPHFDVAPLTGDPGQLAAALRGYEELGVEHLIFHVMPANPRGLARLAEAVRIYREGYN